MACVAHYLTVQEGRRLTELWGGDLLKNQLVLRKGNSLEWGWGEKRALSASFIFRIPIQSIISKISIALHKVSMCQKFN